MRLDTRAGRVLVDGAPVKLTSHEYRLLPYLMHHAGRVVSRTEIVEHLYDQDFDRDSNTIEVFIGRLRKKLGADVLQTVRGLGYVMEPGAADAKSLPQAADEFPAVQGPGGARRFARHVLPLHRGAAVLVLGAGLRGGADARRPRS